MWSRKLDEHFKKYGLLYLVVSTIIVGILFYGIKTSDHTGLGQVLIEPPTKCFSTSKKYGCKTEWTWTFDKPVKTNAITLYSATERTVCYWKVKLTYVDGTVGEFDLRKFPEGDRKKGICTPKGSPYTLYIGEMKEIRAITVYGYCPRKKHPRGQGGIKFLDYSAVTPGPFGEKYCKDDKVYQKYRKEDGSIIEIMIEDCTLRNMKCENGECVPLAPPTAPEEVTPPPTAPEEVITPPAEEKITTEYAPAIPKDWLYIIVGIIVFLGASMIISSIVKRK